MRRGWLAAIAAVLAGCAGAPAAVPAIGDALAPRGEIRPGEVMVAWREAPEPAAIDALASAVGGTAGEAAGTRALIRVPAGQERAACQALRGRAGVVAAEPNRIVRTQQVGGVRVATRRELLARTNDLVWAPARPVFANQPDAWGLAAIRADQAWDATAGDPNIVVAVIDTGVDMGHEDLKANIAGGAKNFVEPGQPPDDDFGHGTHVAGIIAAAGNGGGPAVGLAYQTKVMPIRVLGVDGSGSTWDTIAAIEYAVSKGVAVINMSLGSPSHSQIEADAIQRAVDAGVLVVAAAGNEAQDGNYVEYPASYPNVVSVAATAFGDTRAPFSNFNSWVTIAAPGSDIFSTIPRRMSPTSPYGFLSGTSMASPFVAAAAALVFTQHPTWTPAQVAAQLRRSAREITPAGDPVQGYDVFFGAGLLDAATAVGIGR